MLCRRSWMIWTSLRTTVPCWNEVHLAALVLYCNGDVSCAERGRFGGLACMLWDPQVVGTLRAQGERCILEGKALSWGFTRWYRLIFSVWTNELRWDETWLKSILPFGHVWAMSFFAFDALVSKRGMTLNSTFMTITGLAWIILNDQIWSSRFKDIDISQLLCI